MEGAVLERVLSRSGHWRALGQRALLGVLGQRGLLGALRQHGHLRALGQSSWNRAGSGVDSVLATDGYGLDFPTDGGGRRAADDGGLILAWGRTFSRHRRIPSLHLSPVVSVGIGPVPEQGENGGIIESRRRGEPAELPGILNKCEILAAKGNEAGGDFHSRREKKATTKNIFKNGKQNTGKKSTAHFLFFLVRCSVTLLRGMERGDTFKY